MNRKIYFDDKFIEFVERDAQSSQNQDIKKNWIVKTEADLKSALVEFLKPGNSKNILVLNERYPKAFDYLQKQFYYIEAAGGFIKKNEQYLFIRRHGRWDLPKGKLEKNEKIKDAAIRECEEECGIQHLKINKQLSSSFHLYGYKDAYALKQSYWFLMESDYAGPLVPQAEEDITEVRWFDVAEIEKRVLPDTYFTIADVVREGLSL